MKPFNCTNAGDMVLLARMLLGRVNGTLGPRVLAESKWSLGEQGLHWWTKADNQGEEHVKFHDTMSQGLRRMGEDKLAQVVDWCSEFVTQHLQSQSHRVVHVASWPPTVPEFQKAVQSVVDLTKESVQEVQISRAQYKAVTRCWRKTNPDQSYFDRERPFGYCRVSDLEMSTPHMIRVVVRTKGDGDLGGGVVTVFYRPPTTKPKKAPAKKRTPAKVKK